MRNITEWQLFHLAEALTRAKRLEKNRADHYQTLYNNILYPTVHYDKEFVGNLGSPATDIQAFRLIESKERYDRKIKREYERFLRWQDLLTWVEPHEKVLLVRYFQKKKFVQPKIISRILSKIEKRLEQDERRIEQERLEQSIADYRKYEEATKAFRKKKPIERQDGQKYLVNGRFVYMTPEEYAEHIQQLDPTEEYVKQLCGSYFL